MHKEDVANPDSEYLRPYIIDLNLAFSYYEGKVNAISGTSCYYSPEELIGIKYTTPAKDIWALGVVLWRLKFGKYPFHLNCKKLDTNLKAIADIFGTKPLIKMAQKYHPSVP